MPLFGKGKGKSEGTGKGKGVVHHHRRLASLETLSTPSEIAAEAEVIFSVSSDRMFENKIASLSAACVAVVSRSLLKETYKHTNIHQMACQD